MTEVTIKLFDAEVQDIINVLGELPTKSGAFMLMQKIGAQLQQAKEAEPPKEE
jgi:hypothetical protein